MIKDFKIKLIAIPADYESGPSQSFLPYSLGILAAFLKDNNYNIALDDLWIKIKNNNRKLCFSPNSRIDLKILAYEKKMIDYIYGRSHDRKFEQCVDRIAQVAECEGYDLIGMSVMTYFQFLFALVLSKKIKSIGNTRVVLGGPFITIFGKDLFNQLYIEDYIVVGDGQIPLIKLIEHLKGRLSIEDVPNLLYRQNGTLKANPRRFFPIEDIYMPDFSELSLNSYRLKIDDIKINDFGLILPYQISRGCTHECSFCMRRLVNNAIESKSCNKVIAELKTMRERYQSNIFWFYDDTINCSYEYLNKICDKFIEEKIGIFWRAAARLDNLDRKILRKMKESGCRSLSFGLESGSERIVNNMGKDFDVEKASEILRDSYLEGIKSRVNIIVGFPHEKEEDIIKTTEFIKKNSEYIDTIGAFGPLRLEYGTPLYDNPEMFGIQNLRPISDIPRRLEFRCFAFDEINGMEWEEKLKQQEYYRKRILKVIFKYIIAKKYRFASIPTVSRIYFWLVKRTPTLYGGLIYRLPKHFLTFLRKKKP